jgi:hypothetical protein
MLRGSIPPTGIPMPFISAGGTSLSVFMGAFGVLCNVGKSKESSTIFDENNFKGKLFVRKNKNVNKI